MSMMDQIRCDEKSYLVWKWTPKDPEDKRQNAIRWGSSLRVRDGEMAIFVYSRDEQEDNQDVIKGPYDKILKTANLPVLSRIVGLAYGGNTPFQAEVYFINLAEKIQIMFGVPWFDCFDGRYPDLPVPLAVRGMMTFKIAGYKEFISNNRLIDFSLDELKAQIKAAVVKTVRSVVLQISRQSEYPLVQIQSHLDEVNERLNERIAPVIRNFGLVLNTFDVEAIELDKSSLGYKSLYDLTIGIQQRTIQAQADLSIQNMRDTQAINKENMQESMRIQREELQHGQRMQTDEAHLNVHILNTQAEMMKHAANATANVGGHGDGGNGGGGGMNPGSMMAEMAMASMMGGQMANMMGQSMQHFNQVAQNVYQQSYQQGTTGGTQTAPPPMPQGPQGAPTPPPMPQADLPCWKVYSSVDGQTYGPYTRAQMAQFAGAGNVTSDTLVWRPGMQQWTAACNSELASLFATPVPPVPGGMEPPLPPTR